MITRLKKFLKTTLIGGVVVLLPSFLLLNILLWLWAMVQESTRPLVEMFVQHFSVSFWSSQIIVVLILIAVCFVIGLIIRNRIGSFLVSSTEKYFLSRIPGYLTLKELVGYFLASDKKSAFSSPALIQPWGDDSWVTGFVIEQADDNKYMTVFVPTAPNPSSGFVLHLSSDKIIFLDKSGTEIFKTIVACGSGSQELLAKYINKQL